MSVFAHESGRDSASPFIVWGELLLDDPHAALSDILSGRGMRGAQQRAEPEDFLADLMTHPAWHDRRAQLTEGLDAALLHWLEACVEWPPARINRFGTRAYAARIADALKVAARLPMKVTARHLIRNQSTWDNRFRSLRWPGDIDLLRQFNLVLAQHQIDTRFASRWFAACNEAAWGSPYWQTSLNTGLVGLRKLPDTVDTDPARRVSAALARFAVLALKSGMSTHVVQTTFRRRAAALTVLYPRHDGHWREVWDRAFAVLPSSLAGEASSIRSDWLDHVLNRDGTDGEQPRRDNRNTYGSIARHVDAEPDRRRREQIASAINRAQSLDEDLWEKTRELIRTHWNYAWRSGETYFAVHTTHNLCDRILRLEPCEPYLAEIQVWTLQAIEAEADNAYSWDLWAKVLVALGRDEASLSVRWESIRRFPDNCVLRNSLAEALLERHRVLIAEGLLRETVRDFPSDVFSRHILVKMLWQQGRAEEAEAEFTALEALAPNNAYVRALAEMMTTIRPQEGRAAWPGTSEGRRVEIDTDIRQPSELGQSEERVNGPRGIGSESEISAYLDQLAAQVHLLEHYFAPSERRSGNGTTPGAQRPDEINTEFELVAAHRAGLMEGLGRSEYLESWVSARPSSYSARLLLAWQGQGDSGLNRAAMSRVARDFPERCRWNDWLRYGFITGEERNKLRGEVEDAGDKTGGTFWSGRLSAVYPNLEMEEDENDGAVRYDPVALKRLTEDVAFAGAERALPSILMS